MPPSVRSPKETLAYIRRLAAGIAVPKSVIRELLSSKVPAEVQPYLAGCQSLTMDQVAEQAQNVYKILQRNTAATVAATTPAYLPLPTLQPHAQVSEIRNPMLEALSAIQQEISALAIRVDKSEKRDRLRERLRGAVAPLIDETIAVSATPTSSIRPANVIHRRLCTCVGIGQRVDRNYMSVYVK